MERRYRVVDASAVVAYMHRINDGRWVVANLTTEKMRWYNNFDRALIALHRIASTRGTWVDAYDFDS